MKLDYEIIQDEDERIIEKKRKQAGKYLFLSGIVLAIIIIYLLYCNWIINIDKTYEIDFIGGVVVTDIIEIDMFIGFVVLVVILIHFFRKFLFYTENKFYVRYIKNFSLRIAVPKIRLILAVAVLVLCVCVVGRGDLF